MTLRAADPDTEAELARAMLARSAAAINASLSLVDKVVAAADLLSASFARGGKCLLFGNGGSATDAQHFASELVGRFLAQHTDRAPRPALALTADSAVLTSIANDYAFDDIFARQVQAFGKQGDVLVAITTSGRSPNVLRALEAAPPGTRSIALTGESGLANGVHADIVLAVPSPETASIQAAHIALIHGICAVLEDRFQAPARANGAL